MAMGNKLRLALDLTYPFISYFTGHAFNAVIERFLKDFDILVSSSDLALKLNLGHKQLLVFV